MDRSRMKESSGSAAMTERGANREKNMSSGGVAGGGGGGGAGGATGAASKPVSMKLFAAWEDRTPPNCIPRLCSLIITRLTVLTPLPGDLSSVSVAVKMQSSKRILRSHEIPVVQLGGSSAAAAISGGGGGNSSSNNSAPVNISSGNNYQMMAGLATGAVISGGALVDSSNNSATGGVATAQNNSSAPAGGTSNITTTVNTISTSSGAPASVVVSSVSGAGVVVSTNSTATTGVVNNNQFNISSIYGGGGNFNSNITNNNNNSNSSFIANNLNGSNNLSSAIMEADLDLNFSLQYPHFIKRDGNRLVIMLQRRKKYKTRTILGYKTLAEGVIRMDAVLQKSMDMTVELLVPGKGNRPGSVLATVRAERVSSIPVDHDNKGINSVLIADRNNDYSDEDEEGDFSSGDENEDGTAAALMRNFSNKAGNFRKLDRMNDNDPEDVVMLGQGAQCDSDSDFDPKDKNARTKISRQRNFKQKIVALLKRFKVPEEIEESRHAGRLRPGHQLDELFQELDELSCGDGEDSGPDVDSLSIGSTPKPSLRPFFTNSRNTMHEHIKEERLNEDKLVVGETVSSRLAEKNDNSSGNEAGTTDLDGTITSDSQCINSPPYAMIDLQQQPAPPSTEKEKKLRLMFRSNTTASGGATTFGSISSAMGGGGGSTQTGSGGVTILNTPNSQNSGGIGGGGGSSSSHKKKQSLSLSATEPRSMWESCLSPTNIEPRKTLLDQLARTFATDETQLPDIVCIVGPTEVHGQALVSRLTAILGTTKPLFSPLNSAEVKSIVQALLNKIQKYCNSTAKPPTTIKVLLLGGDWLQGMVLRHYVELLAARPPDWVNHLRFYIVSFGSSSIARYLSSIDASYAMLFGMDNWSQLCERAVAGGMDQTQARPEVIEIVNRIQKYLHNMGPCTQIPIAEAMVNYKEEESCHIFVPFVSDVRLGCPEGPQVSMELDENSQLSCSMLSSSPPNGRLSPPTLMSTSQVVTGSVGGAGSGGGGGGSQQQSNLSAMPQQQSPQESYELQIDYWPIMLRTDSKEAKSANKTIDQGKNSIKSTFRSLQVWRLPPCRQSGEISAHGLTLLYSTKEKKQKIMRLGKKKEKDRDGEKEHCVESVARLICAPKQSHPVPLLVYIDGTEWSGVKFFQLSSQWQTHVKNFPVALIGAPLAAPEN